MRSASPRLPSEQKATGLFEKDCRHARVQYSGGQDHFECGPFFRRFLACRLRQEVVRTQPELTGREQALSRRSIFQVAVVLLEQPSSLSASASRSSRLGKEEERTLVH